MTALSPVAEALAQQVQLAELAANEDWARIPDDIAAWMGKAS